MQLSLKKTKKSYVIKSHLTSWFCYILSMSVQDLASDKAYLHKLIMTYCTDLNYFSGEYLNITCIQRLHIYSIYMITDAVLLPTWTALPIVLTFVRHVN